MKDINNCDGNQHEEMRLGGEVVTESYFEVDDGGGCVYDIVSLKEGKAQKIQLTKGFVFMEGDVVELSNGNYAIKR